MFFVAPTASPGNFKVVNGSSSSLRLSWDEPPSGETHGSIRHYVVYYRVVNCSTGLVEDNSIGWNITTVGESKRSVNINGLSYWTCYDVKIAAYTVGEGPFANVKKVRTSENGMVNFCILILSTFGFILVFVPGRERHLRFLVLQVNFWLLV